MIKDLMIAKNEYVVEYDLTDNLSLYIEGLNCGCCIEGKFDINKVENILVELHKRLSEDSNEESLIYTFGYNTITKYDMLEDLKDLVLDLVAMELEKNNW